ncbi:D-3-phosphoglycerate dehydrogenase [Waddlia chondrophila 2032/99]|uniref:D-3-phosphoglycerate dehydrogenase n=2 Tax=Waddlia chondrophila TaxID=71667 RepID=D6YTH2_WADCW|nr:phosphoglycerate dehydrogenase [Waddlia chondrophila]ADI37433.1 D-3-phosphoglycerate dehydrogenase [Waddlia chondrophila WSU 86-1044]CCB90856.1 D-3-phosphoglycerate dehydrogenase [Waddlia chondrophila 2032/99]
MLSLNKDKIKIVLLEGIDPNSVQFFNECGYRNVELIGKALEGPDLAAVLKEAFILGIRSRTQLNLEILLQAPKLFAIGCYCIGTNQVALTDAASRGIPVFNAPHANTRSVAELVIGWTIMLMRRIFEKNHLAHEGKWKKTAFGSHEVRGKIMGIVGYGHIGSQVSVLAEAMGMQVIYYDIVGKLPLGNARPAQSLEELLQKSDIVTLHVPESAQTKNLLDAERMELMKKGGCLINASRGTTVDLDALKQFLDRGHLAGAALDVFPKEPEGEAVEFNSPLRGDPRVIITPHIGGSTEEAQSQIGSEVSRKLVQYSDWGSTEGAVNFPSLSLPKHQKTHRILNIHKNAPGMIREINAAVAGEGINVQSQYLLTNMEIGYVVLDIEKAVSSRLKEKIQQLEGSIRTRILY